MIFETIIVSTDASGKAHVTPFGIRYEGEYAVISPYKPSTTLNNILATKHAVMSFTDDVRVFAGALTNRAPWQLVPTEKVVGFRLSNALAHAELKLVEVREDSLRPQLVMQKLYEKTHAPFKGFNRAQAAVIELAVLASRVAMLPREKIEAEMTYLQIAIDKTAGEYELAAWQWLREKIYNFYQNNPT